MATPRSSRFPGALSSDSVFKSRRPEGPRNVWMGPGAVNSGTGARKRAPGTRLAPGAREKNPGAGTCQSPVSRYLYRQFPAVGRGANLAPGVGTRGTVCRAGSRRTSSARALARSISGIRLCGNPTAPPAVESMSERVRFCVWGFQISDFLGNIYAAAPHVGI